MSAEAAALLATVPNPYAHARVDSAWEAVPSDLLEIHQDTDRRCVAFVDDVARDRQSHGVLLVGQPGAGKTHALTRVRRHVVESERGWFVYVRPLTAPDRFFRHVLQALTGDVLRPPHGTAHVSQLEVALARHVMADVTASARSVASWWDAARAAHPEPAQLAASLRRSMEPIAEALGIDTHVFRVVIQLAARWNRPEARAWLLGRAVTEDDCRRLEVAGSLDDETAAEEAVVTLLSLGGEGFPVVLAFDQIEGLQRARGDNEGLMAMAHGVDRLFSRCRNVAALTCLQVTFVDELKAAVGKALFDGRLAERGEISIPPLKASEVVQLARGRAEASTAVQQVRLVQRWHHAATPGVGDALWPLVASQVEILASQSPTPREVLRACREMFDERRLGGVATAPVPQAEGPESFDSLLADALDLERNAPLDVIDEGVYVDGLLRVIDAGSQPGLTVERSKRKDVDLVIASPSGITNVSVCHAENMTSLAGRLRRLRTDTGRTGRLSVLRDARLPISPGAVRVKEYLADLQQSGATFARPPVEAYVALAAIRNLLAEAAAGDLTLDGRTVAPVQLKDWLARHLPEAVVDLLQDVVGSGTPPLDDGGERVRAVLTRLKLADVEVVAAEAGLTLDALRRLLAQPGSGLGLVEGVPAVVFLHPDGIQRT